MMEPIWWIIIGALGAPLAWFLFKACLGMFLPPTISGKNALKTMLKTRGVNPHQIPSACLDELTEAAILHAQIVKNFTKQTFLIEFYPSLESIADNTSSYIQSGIPDERVDHKFQFPVTSSRVHEILQGHGLTH